MLVNCAAYQNGRKLGDVAIDDINHYRGMPDCFVWVALNEPGAEELQQMMDRFGLHELAIEDIQDGHERPKIEEFGDSLFSVLHTVELDKDGELLTGSVNIFVGSDYVLSVRNRTSHGFQPVRARCEREPELLKNGPAFVMYALIDNVVDRYFPVLEALSAELDDLEERIFERNGSAAARTIVEDLYSLKRRLVLMHHHTSPLLEAVSKLYGGRMPSLCVGMQEYFRDIYDHLQRIVKIIDGRREMVITAIQVNLGMISLAESEVTKRLGSFAALFAVPTMIAGIYGMNFHKIPELDWTYGYPACITVMLLVDICLWWRFRKAGWL
jgi:magnesium transporter